MGKASRKKKQHAPDVHALHKAGTCTRCGERPRLDTGMWCGKCVDNGRRLRASRPPRIPPRAEMMGMLAALESTLTVTINDPEQETPDGTTVQHR